MKTTTQLDPEVDDPKVLAAIAKALRKIQFGSIDITLHNGQVVQIESKEKIRFQAPTKTP